MATYLCTHKDFGEFLKNLAESTKLIAPVAKGEQFVFEEISDGSMIRLDYDVTPYPPKKFFFPTRQKLIEYDADGFRSCIAPEAFVLFGVHFYDLKAIDQTDLVFRERYADWNYLANRQACTLVGTSVQQVSPAAFWGSVGKEVKPEGQDAFFTLLSEGWHLETFSEKGEALLEFGAFSQASETQDAQAAAENARMLDQCAQKLDHSSAEIAAALQGAFEKTRIWGTLAERCYSCGSCNLVCPTCYCFDVHDERNADGQSGARVRSWDGCMITGFAEISIGEGQRENFRPNRGSRFRHRIMRKFAYLNEKLGSPACIGCGRCTQACTAQIANPVEAIAAVMAQHKKQEA